MKWILIILIGVIMIQTLINPVYANNDLGIAKVNGWNIVKQTGNEANFDVIFANQKDKKTDICFVLKDNVIASSVDLTPKILYNSLGTPILDDKNKIITLKYETAKCLVDGIKKDGYHILLTEAQAININNYIRLGEHSLILVFQDESMINYNFDWGETNITLLKDDEINSNIYIYYNHSNNKIDFGANDYSPTLKNYTYVLNSNRELAIIEPVIYEDVIVFDDEENISKVIGQKEAYTYPTIYNYNYLGDWEEDRQQYSFEGICDKNYSGCSWETSKDKKTITIKFKSYGDIDTKSITPVSACATLSTANEYYNITADLLSTGTCITINNDNITLEGNGHLITYGNSSTASAYYGIYANSRTNLTINNISISQGNLAPPYLRYGMQLITSNSKISNIVINRSAVGFYITSSAYLSKNNIIENLSVYNITTNCVQVSSSGSSNNTFKNINSRFCNYGFYLNYAGNSTLTNLNLLNNSEGLYIGSSDYNIVSYINSSSNTGNGVYLTTSKYNNINNINSLNNRYGISVESYAENSFSNNFNNFTINSNNPSSYGVVIFNSWAQFQTNDNTFTNGVVSSLGSYDVIISNQGGNSTNHTFTNVTYNISKELVTSLGTSSSLIRKWFYQTKVNSCKGDLLSGINVSVYDIDGYLFNHTTDSNGLTEIKPITEYINTNNVKAYQTPINIYVDNQLTSLATFSQSYTPKTITLNWWHINLKTIFIPRGCVMSIPKGSIIKL